MNMGNRYYLKKKLNSIFSRLKIVSKYVLVTEKRYVKYHQPLSFGNGIYKQKSPGI